MRQHFTLLLIMAISIFHLNMTFASHPTAINQAKLDGDIKKLQQTWTTYQANVAEMNRVLPRIKQEQDINKRNASISSYNHRLEQTKYILNQLVLTQSAANQLRQQIIEHATKFQGVYKLAAIDNLSNHQLNAFNRLDHQATSLYDQMLNTAEQIAY